MLPPDSFRRRASTKCTVLCTTMYSVLCALHTFLCSVCSVCSVLSVVVYTQYFTTSCPCPPLACSIGSRYPPPQVRTLGHLGDLAYLRLANHHGLVPLGKGAAHNFLKVEAVVTLPPWQESPGPEWLAGGFPQVGSLAFLARNGTGEQGLGGLAVLFYACK